MLWRFCMFLHHFHAVTVLYCFHLYLNLLLRNIPFLDFPFLFWGLELDVSLEGSSFSSLSGGYTSSGSWISLELVIAGNRLSVSLTVLRLRPWIPMSSWITVISWGVLICCVCISFVSGTLFPITTKLMDWPLRGTQLPMVHIDLGWAMRSLPPGGK